MLLRYFVKQSYCIPFYLGNWSSRRWRWYLSNSPSKFAFSPMNLTLWVEWLGRGILLWLYNSLIHTMAFNWRLSCLCGIYKILKIGSQNFFATKVFGSYYNKVPTIFEKNKNSPSFLENKTLITSFLQSTFSLIFFLSLWYKVSHLKVLISFPKLYLNFC